MPQRLSLVRSICALLPPLVAQRARSWAYPWSRARREDFEFRVASITGSLLCGHFGDFHGYRFAVHGYYDWRNLSIASTVCRHGDTIIEVGANVGTETVGFSDIAGQDGRVIAFEPLPRNVDALRRNLTNWRHHNTELRAAAVADHAGRARFAPPRSAAASGEGHLSATSRGQPAFEIEVDCVTLDLALTGVPNIRLIVIDAEGAEPLVLRGARRVLASLHPALIVEVSPQLLARYGFSVDSLRAMLAETGYTPFAISRLKLRAPPRNEVGTANWLCLSAADLHLAGKISWTLMASALLPPVLRLHPLRRYRRRTTATRNATNGMSF